MDSGTILVGLTSIGTTVVAVLGGLATWKKARDESTINRSDRIEKHMEAQDVRNTRLERRIDVLELRDRLLVDYVFILQRHIQDGKPPPPPPWPSSLTTQPE